MKVKIIEDRAGREILEASRDVNGNFVWSPVNVDAMGHYGEFVFFDFFDWNRFKEVNYDFVRVINSEGKKLLLLSYDSCTFWLDGPHA